VVVAKAALLWWPSRRWSVSARPCGPRGQDGSQRSKTPPPVACRPEPSASQVAPSLAHGFATDRERGSDAGGRITEWPSRAWQQQCPTGTVPPDRLYGMCMSTAIQAGPRRCRGRHRVRETRRVGVLTHFGGFPAGQFSVRDQGPLHPPLTRRERQRCPPWLQGLLGDRVPEWFNSRRHPGGPP